MLSFSFKLLLTGPHWWENSFESANALQSFGRNVTTVNFFTILEIAKVLNSKAPNSTLIIGIFVYENWCH